MDKITRIYDHTAWDGIHINHELDHILETVNALIEEVNDLKQKLAESKNDFTKFVDWIGPLKM